MSMAVVTAFNAQGKGSNAGATAGARTVYYVVVGSFTRGTNAWVWPSKGEARCIASGWGNDGSRIVISPQ